MDDDQLSAAEAARLLDVSLATLYAYVSRGKLRSVPQPGSRTRRYARVDVERLRRRERAPAAGAGEASGITTRTEQGPRYRGGSAVELAETHSVEAVAALLWAADPVAPLPPRAPRPAPCFAALDALVAGEAAVDRAIAHIPFLEQANAQAFDLSPAGFARSGADILRWLTAIFLRQPAAETGPVDEQYARALDLDEATSGLVRRLMILSADHGLEEGTRAVRAVAGTGVTPWRAVATGLAIHAGRGSKAEHGAAVRRLVAEVLAADDPERPIDKRLREHEPVPGFDRRVYPAGDPRARALLAYGDRALAADPQYRRLRHATRYVQDLLGTPPSFALLTAYVALLVDGRRPGTGSPFLVGRAIGWVAHACEQFQAVEAERRAGTTPAPTSSA